MTVNFSTLQVLIDSNLIRDKYLELLFDDSELVYQNKDTHYIFDKIGQLTDDIYWFYVKVGCTTPYSEEVINTTTYEVTKNPREMELLEPNRQLFCFYDNKTKLLFVNNLNLKKMVEDFFQRKLDSLEGHHTVSISNVLSSPDRFAETLSLVNHIGFKYREDLFNTDVLGPLDMFPQPKKLLGLKTDQHTDYELNIRMKEAKVTKEFSGKFKQLVGLRRDGVFKDLICVGKDKNNLDTVFRLDNITKKLEIKAVQNKENRLYDPEEIKANFLEKIGRIDNL